MKNSTMYVGLDVHKNFIEIAIAEEGRNGEVRTWGRIDGSLHALDKVVRKLASKGVNLRFVYEAGPTGYTIYRHLTDKGYDCTVVAPSRIPKASGDRIKNDRRDARNLARLHRAGDLTAVYVPLPEDEAIRDLTRAIENAKNNEKKAKQKVQAFLLQKGFIFSGRTSWSQAHHRWLADLKMPHPSQQIVLQEYLDALKECRLRVERLTGHLREFLTQWRMVPVVQALQALRGVSLITASATVAEIGDPTRFESPVKLMGFLGLVPSEHSSGGKIRRGGITKTGNSHVRRLLVQAAWSYRHPARVRNILRKRQEEVSKEVCDISWKAQLRLCSRYRKLWAKGKPRQVIITAIARELCAFMWAISRETKPQVTS